MLNYKFRRLGDLFPPFGENLQRVWCQTWKGTFMNIYLQRFCKIRVMTNLDMRDTNRANSPKVLLSVDTIRLVNIPSDSAYNNH